MYEKDQKAVCYFKILMDSVQDIGSTRLDKTDEKIAISFTILGL